MTPDDAMEVGKIAIGALAGSLGGLWTALKIVLKPVYLRIETIDEKVKSIETDMLGATARLSLIDGDIADFKLESYKSFAQHDQVDKLRAEMNTRLDGISKQLDRLNDKLDVRLDRSNRP